jgi:hypothetical protein
MDKLHLAADCCLLDLKLFYDLRQSSVLKFTGFFIVALTFCYLYIILKLLTLLS